MTFQYLLHCVFQDFPRPYMAFEVLVFITINATFAAHRYRTLYKLLRHFAPNVHRCKCVAKVTTILHSLVITQRDY